MSIRQKLFLSFTLISILILANSLTAWNAVDNLYQSGQQLLGQQSADTAVSGALDEALQQAQLTSLISTLLAVGACVLSAITISGLISRPLNRILQNLEQTEKGELTASIGVEGKDELAQVSLRINRFTHNLNDILVQISGAMSRLSDHSERMSANSHRSNDKASQQQQDLENLSAATQQLSASVNDVASNAETASRNARTADQHAGEGNRLVSRSALDIQNLSAEVIRSTEKIHALQNRSQSIGGVLDVIQGIAEQTNLLALNAAIEAARAGDSGRGFAVVADEVRTLAQRTQQSTEEISSVITSLQTEADEAVGIMERVQEQGATVAGNTGEASTCLEEINSAVSGISEMNLQIASAAEQQSSVTSDLAENLQRINTLSEETVNETRCTLETSELVSALATDVQQLLSQFRLVDVPGSSAVA